MKKITLTIFIFFLANFCIAQHWNVFNKNYRYNYKFDNSALISNVLFVTSTVQTGPDTIYNMNLVALPCQAGCPTITTSAGPVPNNQIILPFQPQFLQRAIKKYSNGSVLLYDTANFVIQPNCILNQTWVFDNAAAKNATCVAIGTKAIFSATDSVKTIVIGANDTLLLSKNFGIIQFPKPYGLNKYYKLVGIENATSYDQASLYGLKVPNFWDMYNYAIGDMFYTKDAHCDISLLPPQALGSGYTAMFQVTGKTTFATGYTYQTTGLSKGYYSVFDNNCNGFPVTNAALSQGTFTNNNANTENLLYPNALIANITGNNVNVLTSTVNLNTAVGPFNVTRFVTDVNNNFTKQAGVFGCGSQIQNPISATDTFASLYHIVVNSKDYLIPYDAGPAGDTRYICTEGVGSVLVNFGFFEHGNAYCLLSAIKGKDTLYGPMPDYGVFTGIRTYDNELNSNLFYPNPASQKIKFRQPNADVEIYDISGKKVKSASTKENDEMNITDLPQGLYLLRIKSDQKISNEKLIIQK